MPRRHIQGFAVGTMASTHHAIANVCITRGRQRLAPIVREYLQHGRTATVSNGSCMRHDGGAELTPWIWRAVRPAVRAVVLHPCWHMEHVAFRCHNTVLVLSSHVATKAQKVGS